MKEAFIFDIQRFSLHDGPGIRTLIFFKGCSLACRWCANPEGISFEPEIRNDRRLCTGCMNCLNRCPNGAVHAGPEGIAIDRTICQKCGLCIDGCPSGALRWWGKWYTVEELYHQARRDRPFYASSGGGVTLGGGDPLLQNEQAVALLKLCRENGINTAIETAGNYPWAYLENAAPHCDMIHFDLKGWDSDTCKRCIGADNTQIVSNLRRLNDWILRYEHKPRLLVRTPLIPDDNFTQSQYREMAEFLKELPAIERVEILPFHNLGEFKYTQLERPYLFRGSNNLRAEDVEAYRIILEHAQIPVVISTI